MSTTSRPITAPTAPAPTAATAPRPRLNASTPRTTPAIPTAATTSDQARPAVISYAATARVMARACLRHPLRVVVRTQTTTTALVVDQQSSPCRIYQREHRIKVQA